MKVEFVKDYHGPLGRFRRGSRHNLTPNIVGLLPAGYAKEIVSPSDTQYRPAKSRKYRTK